MSVLRRLLAADEAQETRVFVLMAIFGFVVAAIYWFVSYESAGTVLLGGFGLATAVIAARLAADPASRRLRRAAGARHSDGEVREASSGPASASGHATDVTGGGTGGVDRPFSDESGRLPNTTIAPFAVGLGFAVATTGVVFGLVPVVVGALPLAWGAWAWLSAAKAELVATALDDDRG